MPCLLPQKSKTSGSSPSPHRGGKKKTTQRQRNNIMRSLPPAPLNPSTKSTGGQSLATPSQKGPPAQLHGRQSPTRVKAAAPPVPPARALPAAAVAEGRRWQAGTKLLSPYALPGVCQVPYVTFPSLWPKSPGERRGSVWKTACFLHSCPGETYDF